MKALLLTLLLLLNPAPDNIISRFTTPAGYQSVAAQPGSFAAYLQGLPLKPAGTPTKTYRGTIAATNAYTAAVIDLSLGKQDLQQCADAVMRLRGEYLYHQNNYSAISFKFTSGFKCDFVHYANGYRYKNDRWVLSGKKDYSYPNFLRYMNLVFSYGGTLSLEKELQKVNTEKDLKAGDVFIHGGSPGHCFIVMNVAENSAHHKIFMLAQSYMPAQDIQILKYETAWFSLDKPVSIPYGELIDIRYLRKFD
ncbi:DUF4846 domain-containing protein [Mucilaginibacter paludis]|uniref:DUF4846 domain-containing protein n=1 Tax=Mucilaginibacter paludis DSM 18603 TaxID=714943 RepID=H1YD00_9SPHI|nr:DUF4846 domain-containing protein [Mucilaginibacter paludis]EHQ26057.1 hypothetical protein Mucpa_1910 [Mucilaginibacter paludis DSM 18603]